MSLPRNSYATVILIQASLTGAIALLAAVIAGMSAVWAALAGGSILIVGNLAYAWVARISKVSAVSGDAVLMRHVLAEVAKMFLVLVLMFGAFASGWFPPVWLLAAVCIALAGHWIAVLFVK